MIACATGFLVARSLVLTSAHILCNVGNNDVDRMKPTKFFELGYNGIN